MEKIKEKSIKELLEFGIINLNKPSGPTSFSVSEFVKKSLDLRKTSHFGTLDPKVTGVLPVALNRACKLTGFFLGEDKEYVGIMRIHEEMSMKNIQKVIDKKFTGIIKQTPPVKSRVKRQEREREVKRFELLEQSENGKDIVFIAEVEGGTYIRKLIDDLGSELGIGAHMLELRRIRAGIFKEHDKNYPCVSLYDFENAVEKHKNGNSKPLEKIIIPAEIVKEIYQEVQVKALAVDDLLHGKTLKEEHIIKKPKLEKDEIITVMNENRFVGMFQITKEKYNFARSKFV